MTIFLFCKPIVDMLYQYHWLDYAMVIMVGIALTYQLLLVRPKIRGNVTLADVCAIIYILLVVFSYARNLEGGYGTFVKIMSAFFMYFVGRMYYERIQEGEPAMATASYIVVYANLIYRFYIFGSDWLHVTNAQGDLFYYDTDMAYGMLVSLVLIAMYANNSIFKLITMFLVIPYMVIYSNAGIQKLLLVVLFVMFFLYLLEKIGATKKICNFVLIAAMLGLVVVLIDMMLPVFTDRSTSFVADLLSDRLVSADHLYGRYEGWRAAWHRIVEADWLEKLFGVDISVSYGGYNQYMKILYSTGIVGGIVMCVMIFSVLYRVLFISDRKTYYMSVLMSIIFLGTGLNYNTLEFTQMSWFPMMYLGMVVSAIHVERRVEDISEWYEEGVHIEINGKKVPMLASHKSNDDYSTDKQQVFIVGSKGIPANYGGFETFVENLTAKQVSENIRYHVARISDKDDLRYEYNNAKCFDVKVPKIGAAKAIVYDILALRYCINYCKQRPSIEKPIFYVLACRIGPFIKHYKKKIEKLGGVLYVNPDGHEWMRAKWPVPVRKYWKYSEKLMVKHADLLVCDSVNIEKYIQETYAEYKPNTTFIAYGSDVTASTMADDDTAFTNYMSEKGIEPNQYYLVVGRFVKENNYETMLREFMKSKTKKSFVLITTIDNALLNELDKKLHFRNDYRIKFVGTVYDQQLLKKIRENAYAYFHGHEVGGTNPSLLEALGSTKLNLLLDVGFNKEVGEEGALYWNKEDGNLAELISKADAMSQDEIDAMGVKAKARITSAYSWEYIVDRYESLFLSK